MRDNSTKLPGQRYESAVAAMPQIRIPEEVRNAPAPPRNQDATAPRKNTQPPEIPLRWLWQPTGNGTKIKHSPAWRFTMIGVGFLLMCFSSYLTMLAVQHYVPALGKNGLNLGVALSGIAINLVFLAVELAIFQMRGFSLANVVIVGFIYLADIVLNVDGLARMWEYESIFNHGLGTVMLLILGFGAAYLPEKFMSMGWK